jgi:hypothetical protein
LVALGITCAVILCAVAVVTPKRRSGADGVMDLVTKDIYRAVTDGDAHALGKARERVRRVVHKDLLVRSVPGLLRVIDTLSRTPRTCDVRAPGPFQRGVCHIRREQFDQALLAFAKVSQRQGGAVYRDMAVRLMAERRSRLGRVNAPPSGSKRP